MGDFITFISTQNTDSPFGDIPVESEQVFAQVKSIGMNEFYASKGSGIKTDVKFVVYTIEYNNEDKIKYNGDIYKVIRTYRTGLDKLEIVCSRGE